MIAIFYVEFTKKKKKFLCFHSSIFHSKKFIYRGEQGGAGQKFEILCEHTFLNDPKVFLLHLRSLF